MKALKTEIEIAAPVETVWQTLVDFENWKGWNDIFQVSGSASLGSQLKVTARGPGCKKPQNYQPRIIEINPPKQLRWRAKMMGGILFTNDKVFELEPTTHGTRLIHSEEFQGLMVPLCWGKMKEFALPMLKSVNEALKRKIEI